MSEKTKMTSAYANKLIKKLNEDKEYWRAKENEGYLYVAALDEEPVIPEYDFEAVSAKIAEIDEKVCKIKHAINLSNATNVIKVGDTELTIDAVLVKMSQYNNRKSMLDLMRKQSPKTRINSGGFNTKKTVPEYQYINYDLATVAAEYERIDAEISQMQLALDKYNQTFEFEVEL